jgi:hypothetical protein
MLMFIQRYGNPTFSAPENAQFASYFRSNIGIQFLNSVMTILLAKSQGRYVTDDVARLCLQYLTHALQLSPTYKIMKQHLDLLLVKIIFPTLCLTEQEEELFESDPTEYIKIILSSVDDCLDARIAAMEFLQTMAKLRHGDLFLKFLPFLQSLLAQYASAPVNCRDYRSKDGAMLSIVTIADIFRSNKKYRSIMPSFLVSHVFTEFSSPVAFIRARACWVIEHTMEIDYVDVNSKTSNKLSNTSVRTERLRNTIQGMLNCLRDPHLPVQTAAANAIGGLIEFEVAAKALEPLIPDLVTEYFRIIGENSENRDLLVTLQTIVTKYGDIVKPFAEQMALQLQQMFFRMIGANVDGLNGKDDNDDIEEGSVFSAASCLETITTVLDICQDDIPRLQQLEVILMPLMHRLLKDGEHSFEYLSAGLEMVGYFTYFLDTFSPNLWSLCGYMLEAINGWAFDFMREVLPPLLNFVTKDVQGFLAGSHNSVSYMQWLFNAIEKGLASTVSDSEHDARVACSLMTCLLLCIGLHAPGMMDNLLGSIVNMFLFSRMQACKTLELRIQLLEVGLACVYYNPGMTFHIMEATQTGAVQAFFGVLLQEMSQNMDNQQSKRLVIYAFTKVMTVMADRAGAASVPDVVSSNISGMFREVIRSAVWVEENDIDEEEEDEDDDDFVFADDVDFGDDDVDLEGMKAVKRAIKAAGVIVGKEEGFHEDEDCVNEEDEAFQEAINDLDVQRQRRATGNSTGATDGSASKEDDDDFDDLRLADMDDFAFTMPVALQNVSAHVVSSLKQVQATDPAFATLLQSSLAADAELKAQFDSVMAKANSS